MPSCCAHEAHNSGPAHIWWAGGPGAHMAGGRPGVRVHVAGGERMAKAQRAYGGRAAQRAYGGRAAQVHIRRAGGRARIYMAGGRPGAHMAGGRPGVRVAGGRAGARASGICTSYAHFPPAIAMPIFRQLCAGTP